MDLHIFFVVLHNAWYNADIPFDFKINVELFKEIVKIYINILSKWVVNLLLSNLYYNKYTKPEWNLKKFW